MYINLLWIKLELLQFFIQIRDVSEVCPDDTETVRVEAVGILAWKNTNIHRKEVGKDAEQRSCDKKSIIS